MNQIVSPEGSDSIRGSDNAVQEADEHLICSSASNLEGIELKVGLPGTRRGQHVVSQVGQSGVRDLCSVASEANIVMPSQGREGDYREVVEAVRLMGLQQELGVRFHGSDEEDLQRAIDVETRDRKEKEDWEQQRCDWVFLPAVGNSGGLLSLWNKSKATRVFDFSGEGFVGVCLDLHLEQIREKGAVRPYPYATTSEMVEFDSFLTELQLEDCPIIGRNFTWFHPNGVAMSRFDRVLISSVWSEMWPNPHVRVLSRDVSDHCPLVLKYDASNWGPKPFRLNNFWLHNKKFKELVEKTWREHIVSGWMGFILKERFKGLKVTIKQWNQQVLGDSEEIKRKLILEIMTLDQKSEVTGLSQQEVAVRKNKFDDLLCILKSIDAAIFQRSRSKWLKAGDANTAYFHSRVKMRRRRNGMVALLTLTGWAEGPANVRAAAVNFFRTHFQSVGWDRPTLDGLDFTQITADQNMDLVQPFTGVEIEDVVKAANGTKSPGPDGLVFAFIKSFWALMKYEVRIMFDQFHGNECLPKSLLSYFVTLIPKVNSPQALSEFRPISLLGCLYKKKPCGRGGGLVAVNEIIDWAKKNRESFLIFKVDFEKAYDSVDWGFLDYILRRFGFSDKWRAWMRACVCSGSMSALVNGSPTEEISIKRGLKQGDPLAPHLFLLVAEGLGALMRKAVEIGRFKPYCIGRERERFSVSLLQYADDTLCIGEASMENLWTLKAVLRGFEMASGLKVNFWKSSLIEVNVAADFMLLAANFLNCRIGKTLFKYLGLPEVIKIQRNFLWSGLSNRRKISWVKWEDVCKPKSVGGLGVRDLRLTNISLLAKWRWKLLQPHDELWKDIVVAKYGNGVVGRNSLGEAQISRFGSTWWRNICLLDNNSSWLYSISLQQELNLSQMGGVVQGGWRWSLLWRREFFSWEEPIYHQFLAIIDEFQPVEREDSWRWKIDPQLGYTAMLTYHNLILLHRPVAGFDELQHLVFNNIWKSAAPSKVIAFSWQMLLDSKVVNTGPDRPVGPGTGHDDGSVRSEKRTEYEP
ncbi:cysteine-rich receptor-like protein kinase, partial [Trifolium pratense]